MKKYYFIVFLVGNISFGQTVKDNVGIPKLILTESDTIIYSYFKKMQAAAPKVYGIGIKDSLKLTEAKWEMASQNVPLKKKEDFVFYVDTSDDEFHSHFTFGVDAIPLPPLDYSSKNYSRRFDSTYTKLKTNLDKKERVHLQSYPFFLYNKFSEKITVSNPISSSDLYVIMEALDRNNEWHPIEFLKQYSFLCGTGHMDYVLKPNTFLIGAVKRYTGDYKTKLRLKLATTGFILYSNEFKGEINYSQFNTTWLMYDLISKFAHGDNSLLDKKIKAAFLNN